MTGQDLRLRLWEANCVRLLRVDENDCVDYVDYVDCVGWINWVNGEHLECMDEVECVGRRGRTV